MATATTMLSRGVRSVPLLRPIVAPPAAAEASAAAPGRGARPSCRRIGPRRRPLTTVLPSCRHVSFAPPHQQQRRQLNLQHSRSSASVRRGDGRSWDVSNAPPRRFPSSSPSAAAFSTAPPSPPPSGGGAVPAFDRNLKLLQRNGAALAHRKRRSAASPNNDDDDAVDYDYFRRELSTRLVDRLDDIKRDGGFPLALDLGSGPGYVHRAICADDAFDGMGGGIGGVRKLVQLDSSELMLRRDAAAEDGDDGDSFDGSDRCDTYRLVSDEEGDLPFPDGTFDLVLSSGSLHWVNDLPRLLSEARRVLKPDGCLMFVIVGGSTLSELRSSLVLAEMERDGGVSTHVGPFVDFADVGQLLTAAGFTLPTVDVDTIKIAYPSAMVLMEHLQRMGEGNACASRRDRVGADAFLAAACLYDDMYRLETEGGVPDEEGSVEATVQVIYAIGWTPHDSQPKPLERGSATRRVGDVVDEPVERGR